MIDEIERVHAFPAKELPNGWRTATLPDLIGETGIFIDGDWIESKDQDPSGDVRLIQLADIGDGFYRDRSDRFLTSEKAKQLRCTVLQPGDMLIARMPDPLGRACIFPGDRKAAVTVVDVAVVRTNNPQVNSRWLMYCVNAPQFRSAVASLQSGSTRLRISRKNLSKVVFPFPPHAVQDEIVAEIEKQFSRLDEAVANLQRVKANLKRYKASVLKDAVEGRLVPTEAELARREGRSFETGEQLLKRILETRRNTWNGRGKYKEATGVDACNLPELPEGRVWATLGQLTSSVKDGPHFSPKYADSGVPFISGGNIRPEGIDFSSTKFITPELHAELSKRCKPEPGDLLYTKGGTTGIARVNTETREFNVWVHVAVLKLIESVHPFYLQHALNSPHCYRQSQKHTHGVGNQDLGLTRMVWITVPLPPYAEQLRIVDEVERRLSLVRGVEGEVDANLKRAQALRQSCLASAFMANIANGNNL